MNPRKSVSESNNMNPTVSIEEKEHLKGFIQGLKIALLIIQNGEDVSMIQDMIDVSKKVEQEREESDSQNNVEN